MIVRKIGFMLLWLGFSLYAFTLAPPSQPDTTDLIIQLSTGQWNGINPAVVALFNLMGVWPMIYACLALIDGAGNGDAQKLPAWPFVSLSFGVGAFALLPYLALRNPTQTFEGEETKLLNLVDSPWTGRAIALAALVLLTYGITSGDWGDFAQQWQTSRFIHVMSLDFCVLCAVVGPLVKSDMAKRQMNSASLFWLAALVPLLGVVFYLSVRSPLVVTEDVATPISGAAS